MSVKELKASLTALLTQQLAQRGFTYEPLKKKDPNANRHVNFRKLTPTGSRHISIDLYGRSCLASGVFISIHLDAFFRIDALSELLDDQVILSISPGSINRGGDHGGGGGSSYSIADGDDPGPCVQSILDTIDTTILPRFEKYASLENIVECLSKLDEHSARELGASGFASSGSAMAAIGAAFLLNDLDLCDDIARRATAMWQPKSFKIVFNEFLDRKQDFYERHLRFRGVKPDAWLLPPEDAARLRAERPPKPGPRWTTSPTIWIDGTSGLEAPARFEYGYQLLVIGTGNREFVQSLTEVAHKLTTGRYSLMMAAPAHNGKKPTWGPHPISYRRLVIDGKWALDWTPPPASAAQPSKPPANQSSTFPNPHPSQPASDPNPDGVSIINKFQPGWSPFYFRTGYAMYPATKGKAAQQRDGRELIPTLTEVAARLRAGTHALMMSHDRTGALEIFQPDTLLIDGKPAIGRSR